MTRPYSRQTAAQSTKNDQPKKAPPFFPRNTFLLHATKLGLTPTHISVILQHIAFWWHPDRLPFVSDATIAKRTGRSRRQVQRIKKDLRDMGFLICEARFVSGRRTSSLVDYRPLVSMLKYFEKTGDLLPRWDLVGDLIQDVDVLYVEAKTAAVSAVCATPVGVSAYPSMSYDIRRGCRNGSLPDIDSFVPQESISVTPSKEDLVALNAITTALAPTALGPSAGQSEGRSETENKSSLGYPNPPLPPFPQSLLGPEQSTDRMVDTTAKNDDEEVNMGKALDWIPNEDYPGGRQPYEEAVAEARRNWKPILVPSPEERSQIMSKILRELYPERYRPAPEPKPDVQQLVLLTTEKSAEAHEQAVAKKASRHRKAKADGVGKPPATPAPSKAPMRLLCTRWDEALTRYFPDIPLPGKWNGKEIAQMKSLHSRWGVDTEAFIEFVVSHWKKLNGTKGPVEPVLGYTLALDREWMSKMRVMQKYQLTRATVESTENPSDALINEYRSAHEKAQRMGLI